MPFTADEIANINNSTLETFIEKGEVLAQNISNKPMLKAFDEARGSFVGGNTYVSVGVKTESGFEVMAYVNNLFDENPILSFDRERGGRARLGFNIGQPRTYGITARQKF